jgi:hypothetical protein
VQSYFAHRLFRIIKEWLGALGCDFPHFKAGVVIDKPYPSIRDLARRLLAVEAASQSAADPRAHETVRVFVKLRVSLTRFAGADGFASLLRRALVLASADVPSLQSVKIGADGRLEGFEQVVADTGTGAAGVEAAIAITTHLLGLLVTFIGEPLTLRLLRGAWPEISLDEERSKIEANS